jgi:hypothetical protein
MGREAGLRLVYPPKSDHRIFRDMNFIACLKINNWRQSVPLRAGLRRDRESVQSLENQGPSRLVRLCQTIFYKKNMQAATENPYELRAFPMISNQFQSLF